MQVSYYYCVGINAVNDGLDGDDMTYLLLCLCVHGCYCAAVPALYKQQNTAAPNNVGLYINVSEVSVHR